MYQDLYNKTLDAMRKMAEEYGGKEIPERLMLKAQKIIAADSDFIAQEVATKVQQSMQIHLLAAWANGKIPGKVTQTGTSKQVKSALNLAKYFESKGMVEQAEAQRKRATKLQEQLDNVSGH